MKSQKFDLFPALDFGKVSFTHKYLLDFANAEGIMKYAIIFFLGIFLLSGCATGPTPQQLANADYGPPPPANYKDLVKKEFELQLIDPVSAIYRFNEPSQGYIKASPLYGTQLTFGWRACGLINAKNRFGGYVGWEPFFVLFKNKSIVFSTFTGIGNACVR